MYKAETVEVAHFVALLSTRMSQLTINQKSTVQSTPVTQSCQWRCALVNSRVAENIFYCYGKWYSKRKDMNVATKPISQKIPSSRTSHQGCSD